MKACSTVEVQLENSKWEGLASGPCCFTPGGTSHSTRCTYIGLLEPQSLSGLASQGSAILLREVVPSRMTHPLLFPMAGLESRIFGNPDCNLVHIPTELLGYIIYYRRSSCSFSAYNFIAILRVQKSVN